MNGVDFTDSNKECKIGYKTNHQWNISVFLLGRGSSDELCTFIP